MSEKKSYQAWTISDEFWEVVKGEIPKKEREPAKEYKNAPVKAGSQYQQGTR